MRFCRVVTNGLNFLFLLLVFVHSSSTNLSLLSFWFIHNAPLRVNSGQSPIDRKVTTRPSSPSSSSLSSSSLREIYGDDLEDNGDSAGFRFECTIQDADCAVRRVDCNNEVIPYVDSLDELPPSAYDVRVEPFARAVPQKAERYWLSVSISWQVPTNTLHMPPKAFLLEVTALNIINSSNSCFLFNISGSRWTPYLLTSSPRLHFSTENLFKFGDSYEVNVISLPRSAAMASMTTKKITMPGRPDLNTANSGLHFDCSRFSNSDASKWTAGFRHVSVYSLPRTIHIEFVGAPPHYCFEAYEVRLKDGTRQDLLRSSIIPVKAMHTEYVGDNAVTFGEYNFTNLEVKCICTCFSTLLHRTSDTFFLLGYILHFCSKLLHIVGWQGLCAICNSNGTSRGWTLFMPRYWY
ncbi:hypothetical protein AB6A40_003612 [Gnathostoma spinigerum]|uniref:ILCR1 Ig-like domain-containing protein n=1 Tax=Gnathostoma spinigerum TaxID=75299 RepID=A0ABD6EIV4_9BILA